VPKPTKSQITGVLLAGGRSSRMFPGSEGPADKGLLEIAGSPMLRHVLARFAPQVGRAVLNANGDPGRFAALELPVVADTSDDYAGPLAGLLAGMRWSLAHAPGATHIATVATDTPFIPRDHVAKLAARAGGPRIVFAASGGQTHPVIGLYPVALADDLEAALAAGARKVFAWLDRHDTAVVSFDAAPIGGASIDPFFNVNTPADLATARAVFALLEQPRSR